MEMLKQLMAQVILEPSSDAIELRDRLYGRQPDALLVEVHSRQRIDDLMEFFRTDRSAKTSIFYLPEAALATVNAEDSHLQPSLRALFSVMVDNAYNAANGIIGNGHAELVDSIFKRLHVTSAAEDDLTRGQKILINTMVGVLNSHADPEVGSVPMPYTDVFVHRPEKKSKKKLSQPTVA